MEGIYWCQHCNSPLLSSKCDFCRSSGHKIASDVRPIFPKEKLLWEILLDYPEGYFSESSMWDTKPIN